MHIALENQEIDLIGWSDSQNVVSVPERTPGIEPILEPMLGVMYLALNMAKEPWKSNKDLRMAIRYATDPRPYAENYAPGCQPVLTQLQADPRYAKADWEWDESWYDIEKAKQYLEAAGYPDGEGLGTITAVGTPTSESFMPELAQAQLAQIGIDVEVLQPDVPEAVAMWQNGEYDIATLGDIGTSDPSFMIKKYFIPGGALTWVGFYDYDQDVIDKLSQAEQEPDKATRDALFVEIYDILLEELPLIWLHDIVFPRLKWDYVKGYVIWPDIYVDYTHIWLDK
jgi:ABC-type transport system substrate-binding protein